jgi:hypothetical protein
MRSVYLSAYRIALVLKVRRQSVDRILGRPHVAAMVEDFRKLASAHGVSLVPLSLQELLSATSARPRRDDNR